MEQTRKWVLVLVPTRITSQGNGRSKLLRLNVGQIVDQLIQVAINIILELREEFKVTILAKLPVPHLLIFQVKGKMEQYKNFKKINPKMLKITYIFLGKIFVYDKKLDFVAWNILLVLIPTLGRLTTQLIANKEPIVRRILLKYLVKIWISDKFLVKF